VKYDRDDPWHGIKTKTMDTLDTSRIIDLLSLWDFGSITAVEAFRTDKYRYSGNVYFFRCGEARYVLKRIDRQRAHGLLFTVLTELYKRGIPVAPPIPARDGRLAVCQDAECYYVAPFLKGAVSDDHFGIGMERRSRSFGKALAGLHAGLREIVLPSATQPPVPKTTPPSSPTPLPKLSSLSQMDLLGQVKACAAEARVRRMSGEVIGALEETSEAFENSGPLSAQLIHRDCHAANVLYLDDEVTGWLDFELTTIGSRLFDLCYYTTSLLMDALSDPGLQRLWLMALENVVGGYREVETLTAEEHTLLPYVLLAIEAVFILYFLKANDAAGVGQNVQALEWLHGNLAAIRKVTAG